MKKICVILALVMLVALPCCVKSKKSVKEKTDRTRSNYHYQVGLDFFSKGEFDRAEESFAQAYQLNPKDPLILEAMGLVAMAKSEWEQAYGHFVKALPAAEEFPRIYTNMAASLLEMRKPDEAIAYCRKALDNPSYMTKEKAYYNLGQAYLLKRDRINAKEYFIKSIQANPMFDLGHEALGDYHLKAGETEKAAKSLGRAADLNPNNFKARYSLGMVFLSLDLPDRAKTQFQYIIDNCTDISIISDAKLQMDRLSDFY